ncbi:MAG: ABC transporter ATP-binding protein [Hyphomicrobiales bacterium]|nr:ABC transporter ATP-binding protein [Hyphomicrobiales bacterium]
MLAFQDITKVFYKGDQPVVALEGLDLSITEGEFVSVIGPSGCGKSTLLNLAAGLGPPAKGRVLYRGRPVEKINTAVGYITQHDNLLPWSTVRTNITMGLKIRKVPAAEREQRLSHYMEITGLKGFENHYPAELSGGMRKRTSMARTLIYSPEMVLMDEPFSALDAHVKMIMHQELLRIWDEERKTILFITHDLVEAITLSDRIVVLSARPGQVKQEMRIDLPRPRDPFTLHTKPEFTAIFETLWEGLKDDIYKGENV